MSNPTLMEHNQSVMVVAGSLSGQNTLAHTTVNADEPNVTFAAASSHHMVAPSRAFQLATGGGCTVVARVRFTSTPTLGERILECGNGNTDNTNTISLRRSTGVNAFVFELFSGTTAYAFAAGTIVQNNWHDVVGRYNASTGILELLQNASERASLTSLPLTAMTSGTSGLYVATASSQLSNFFPYLAFDGVLSGANFWHSERTYDGTSGVYTGSVTTVTTNAGTLSGEWLQIQLPGATAIQSFTLRPRDDDTLDARMPRDFSLVASNDGVTWTRIYSATGIVYDYSTRRFYLNEPAAAYSIYRLITHVMSLGSTTRDSVLITEWKLETLDPYGIASAASILNYPPTAMTSNSSGGYTASASSTLSGYPAYLAFDKINPILNFWHSNENTYNNVTGVYIGSVTTVTTNAGTLSGEWLQLQAPSALSIGSFTILSRQGEASDFRAPMDFSLVASTNGTTWTRIYYTTGERYFDNRRFYLSAPMTTYSYFRLITHVVSIGSAIPNNRGSVAIAEMVFEGPFDPYRLTVVGAISGVPALADRTLSTTYLGRTSIGGTTFYANMDLAGLILYDRALSNSEVVTCLDVLHGRQPTSAVPATRLIYSLVARGIAAGAYDDMPVSAWGSFTQGTSANQPRFWNRFNNWTGLGPVSSTGLAHCQGVAYGRGRWVTNSIGTTASHTLAYSEDGTTWTGIGTSVFSNSDGAGGLGFGKQEDNIPHLRFLRTSGESYEDPTINRILNIATNGGFTVVVRVRFTGAASNDERVIFFSNGGENMSLTRVGTTTAMAFRVYAPSNTVWSAQGGTIVQNQWTIWVGRYASSTNQLQLFQNGALVATTTLTETPHNRSHLYKYLARSVTTTDAFSNIDLAGVAVYDRALVDAEVASCMKLLEGAQTESIPYVRFAANAQQVMTAPSTTMNIATNGGFTAVARFRFYGPVVDFQRVFDIGATSDGADNILALLRAGSGTQLRFSAFAGVTNQNVTGGTIVQNQWTTVVCRYTHAGTLAELFQDGVRVASGTLAALSNRTALYNYLGRSFSNGVGTAWSNLDLAGLVVYARSLTDAEVGTVTQVVLGSVLPSALPSSQLVYTQLASQVWGDPGDGVVNWSAFSNTDATRPVFGRTTAPHVDTVVQRYVSFRRAASQFMAGPSTALNIGTGGGFTVVTRFRFTGTAAIAERVFEFNNGLNVWNNVIHIARGLSTTNIEFFMGQGAVVNEISGGAIVQNKWTTVVGRYTATGNVLELFQDGVRVANGTTTSALSDRTLAYTYIAESTQSVDPFANLDLAGLVVYARSLSDAEISTVTGVIVNHGTAASLPATPVTTLLPNALASTHGQLVPTWDVFAQATASQQPTYGRITAPSSVVTDGYVAFQRASSHFLQNPTTASWSVGNVAGGGFTVLVRVRFTHTPAPNGYERVFDFGNGVGVDNIGLSRHNVTTGWYVYAYNGSTALFATGNLGTVVQNQWTTMVVRYTRATNLYELIQDERTIYSTTPSTPIAARTTAQNWLGRSPWADAYTNMDLMGLVAYDRSLSDAEVETVSAVLTGAAASTTLPSTGMVYTLLARTLNLAAGAFVSSWGGFVQTTGFQQPMFGRRDAFVDTVTPAYTAVTRYVSFARSSQQFMSLGSTAFNIGTGGGFTAVTRFRFTGPSVGNQERVFDLGNALDAIDGNTILSRSVSTTSLAFWISQGSSAYNVIGGSIAQDKWTTVVCRYTVTGNVLTLFQDGLVVASGTTGVTLTNRTFTNNFIGRSRWSADAYSNLDLAGLVVYARSLSDAEVATVTNILIAHDTTAVPLPATPVLTLLPSALTLDNAASMSASWGGFTQATASQQPLVNTFVDTVDSKYVVFTRTSSHFLQAPARAFNIATNGGFTAAVRVRFVGTSSDYERIFDFGPALDSISNQIVLTRSIGAPIEAWIMNGGAYTANVTGGNLTQNQWTTLVLRYTVSTQRFQLYQDGSLVASQTSVATLQDRTLSSLLIARSNTTSNPYSNVHLSGLVVYARGLSDAEVVTVTNVLTQVTAPSALPASQLVYQLLPSALTLQHGSVVASWDAFVQTTPSAQPVYTEEVTPGFPVGNSQYGVLARTRLVPDGAMVGSWGPFCNPLTTPLVSFARTGSQFMSAGSTSFPVSTGGGFTAVTRFRFTSAAGLYERVFDFGNGAPSSNFNLSRVDFPSVLNVSIYEGTTRYFVRGGVVVQNQWSTVVIRYTKSSNLLELFQDGVRVGTTSVGTMSDRTLSTNYIARSLWSVDPYPNLDLNGLVVYARSLSDAEVQTVTNIVLGVAASSSLPATPVYSLLASSLALAPGAQVSSWGSFSQGTVANQPTFTRDVAFNQPLYSNAFVQWVAGGMSSFSVASQPSLAYAYDGRLWAVPGAPNAGNNSGLFSKTFAAVYNPARRLWLAGGQGTSPNTTYRELMYSEDGLSWTAISPSPFRTTGNTAFAAAYTVATASYPLSFPKTALTADSSSGCVVTYSSRMNSNTSGWNAFNHVWFGTDTDTLFWHSGVGYNVTSGVALTTYSTTVDGVTVYGEWLQIQLPQAILLARFRLTPRRATFTVRSPNSFVVAGSNNGTTWTTLFDTTSTYWTSPSPREFVVPTIGTTAYAYFRLITRVVGNADQSANRESVQITEWQLYDANEPLTHMWLAGGEGTAAGVSVNMAYATDPTGTWTPVPSSTSIFNNFCYDIKWNGVYWLAAGRGSTTTNALAISGDGKTWYGLGAVAGQTAAFRKLCWTGTYWMVTGDSPTFLALSYDGFTWTAVTGNRLFTNSQAVGIGSNYTASTSY